MPKIAIGLRDWKTLLGALSVDGSGILGLYAWFSINGMMLYIFFV